jgi:hypothetical protein
MCPWSKTIRAGRPFARQFINGHNETLQLDLRSVPERPRHSGNLRLLSPKLLCIAASEASSGISHAVRACGFTSFGSSMGIGWKA